jgi:hypothetical protein
MNWYDIGKDTLAWKKFKNKDYSHAVESSKVIQLPDSSVLALVLRVYQRMEAGGRGAYWGGSVTAYGRVYTALIKPANPVYRNLKGELGGIFFLFSFYVRYSTLLHLPPLRLHCSTADAGIEPGTVATLASAVRYALTTRLDLIHAWLDLIQRRYF